MLATRLTCADGININTPKTFQFSHVHLRCRSEFSELNTDKYGLWIADSSFLLNRTPFKQSQAKQAEKRHAELLRSKAMGFGRTRATSPQKSPDQQHPQQEPESTAPAAASIRFKTSSASPASIESGVRKRTVLSPHGRPKTLWS